MSREGSFLKTLLAFTIFPISVISAMVFFTQGYSAETKEKLRSYDGGIFSGIVWVATLLFLFSGSVFSVSIRSKNDFGLFFSFLFLFIVLRVVVGRRKKVLNNKTGGEKRSRVGLGEIWAFELRKTFASLFFSSGQ